MIKLDIVSLLAERTDVSQVKAEQVVDTLFHSMKEALVRGERIELRVFGVFVVKPKKSGIGRNPRTGEEAAIASGKKIRFKPGKELRTHDEPNASKSWEDSRERVPSESCGNRKKTCLILTSPALTSMANINNLKILIQRVAEWNKWRKENPGIYLDLNEAMLRYTAAC